jgi:hypothetical protein
LYAKMRRDQPRVSTILCFLIGCLYGACALEAYDHDPVVIIDENDVRRLGLAAKPRDTILNEPVKPVVIIDENEVRRFNMPTKSSKEKKNARRKNVVKESPKPNSKNATKKTHHCSTIFIHGRCPDEITNEVEKTFWVPENDIKFFGENTLDTTTLLNISEKIDSTISHASGRKNIGKPIGKPSIKMNAQEISHDLHAKATPAKETPVPSSILKPKVVASKNKMNSTLNDYKIGLYKISKLTNNGNDTKNGVPLSANISVSHVQSQESSCPPNLKCISLSSPSL